MKTSDAIAIDPGSDAIAIDPGSLTEQAFLQDEGEMARLRESELQFRAVFDAIDEGACIFERLPTRPDGWRDYRYVAMNSAMQTMFEVPDLTGQTIRDHFPSEEEHWYDDYDRVLETGMSMRFERKSESRGMILEMFISRLNGVPNRLLAVMQDITKRRHAEEALRRSEERFRALVTASSDVVYRMSPDWWEMRQLDGRGFLSDTEGPTIRWMDDYIFPEDQVDIRAAIDRAIDARVPFELEHRVRQANGAEGWTFSRAIPVFEGDGTISEWFGMAADVTERIRAENHQKLLVNELNHRVKNTLASIQSIVGQTLKGAQSKEDASTAIFARIMAFSRAHDLLTNEKWNGADLKAMVEQALGAFQHLGRRAIHVSGPTLRIGPQAALSLALAIQELATNAAKYGALSSPTGIVDIRWSAEPDNNFKLVWTESGGPAVTQNNRQGFGSRLILQMLPYELQGTAEIDYGSSGVVFTLETTIDAISDKPLIAIT